MMTPTRATFVDTRRVCALLCAMLACAFAAGAQAWTVDRLWGVRTTLENPQLPENEQEIEFSIEIMPEFAEGEFELDVQVLAGNKILFARTGLPLDETLTLDLRGAGAGLLTVEARVYDEERGERVFRTYLINGDWERAKQSLGRYAREVMRRLSARGELDPARHAVLRFASHWSAAYDSRFSERHTELFAQTYNAVSFVDWFTDHGLPFRSQEAIPMAIDNPLADEGVGIGVSRFWLMYPKGYPGRDDWPLVIFLHGSGGKWPDMTSAMYGPVRTLMQRDQGIPAVVLIAKSDDDGNWNPDLLDPMLDWVLEHTNTDDDRVLLTGLSMGGKGTWEWAMQSPERFAALVPACGNANPIHAHKIAHIPTWNTHGTADPLVDFYLSQHIHDMLERHGSDARFDVRVGEGHNVWQHRYEDPEFWEWFLAQRRTPMPASVPNALEFDAQQLSQGEVIDLPELVLAHQELGRAWDSVRPQANSRIVGNFYQATYQQHGHEAVFGPHGFGEVSGSLVTALLLRADTLPEDADTIALPGESFNRNLRGDRRASQANLADRPRELDLTPFEARRVYSVFYKGAKADHSEAVETALERARSAGHTITGPAWTRVWWDAWDEDTCLREVWVPIE